MRNFIIWCSFFILCGCASLNQPACIQQGYISPPVYQGVSPGLTHLPDIVPNINVETATQDDIAVLLAELWKQNTIMIEQLTAIRAVDDKFKVLYEQYVEKLKKD